MYEHIVGIFAYKCLVNEEFSAWFDYRTRNYVTRASETNPLHVYRVYTVQSEQSNSNSALLETLSCSCDL